MKIAVFNTAMASLLLSVSSLAEDNNFLTDYTVLSEDTEYGHRMVYVTPGAFERMVDFHKVMIDQPEIFLDPESKYKGMKPDTMVNLAEGLRQAVITGVSEEWEVTEEPGESVLFVRWALTNMYIKKPKRGLLSYTPVGAIAHAAMGAGDEFVEKNTLVEITLEMELLDSVSGEILAAAILQRGQRKDKAMDIDEEAAGWDELMAVATGLGKRLGCRLNNARVPEGEREDCVAIPITAEG